MEKIWQDQYSHLLEYYEVNEGIRNYLEFEAEYSYENKEWITKRNNSYKSIYKILDYIKEIYKVDPIKFLHYKYNIEEKSTIDFYDDYYKIWNYKNKNKDNFVSIFNNTFWWKLRECNNTTDKTRKKITNTKKTQMQPAMEAKEKTIEKVETLLKRIQKKGTNNNGITKKELGEIKTIFFKTMAILESIWININPNHILKLSNKFWTDVTAKAVKNILEENWFWDINFIKGRISEYKTKSREN